MRKGGGKLFSLPPPFVFKPLQLCRCVDGALRVVIRRDDELLPDLYFVGVAQLAAVGVEDAHVLVRVAVELFADLRERVARLDRVALAAPALPAADRRALRALRDADV